MFFAEKCINWIISVMIDMLHIMSTSLQIAKTKLISILQILL